MLIVFSLTIPFSIEMLPYSPQKNRFIPWTTYVSTPQVICNAIVMLFLHQLWSRENLSPMLFRLVGRSDLPCA